MKTVINRAFRFRLYPTDAQDAELREWERQLRWLYNLAHEQRLLALGRPRGEQPRVDYFRQSREMTELIKAGDLVQLGRVVCSARQEILRDLDKAWQRWRKRLSGKPHFKRRTDAVRIYFSTTKHWSIRGEGKRALLSLAGAAASAGAIELRLDRAFPKDAKATSCHLVRDVDQWYAVFPLTFAADVVLPPKSAVGINRGAVHAIADSDGRVVDSPGYYTKALGKIAKLSRDLKRKDPGSRNYHKAAGRLAKAHRKIRRQREWFLHQQSAYYTSNYRMIAIEDWSTKGMTTKEPDEEFPTREVKRAINRSILDVGWYELARQIKYKVETSGGEVREVPVFDWGGEEIGISSVCSVCGAPLEGPASGRKSMRCDACAHAELGDENAARNVLVRAENMTPPSPSGKKAKTSIKIKGRQKRSETAGNPPGEASGGDPPVRGPDEGGTYACTVLPGEPEEKTHPAMRDAV
jgi:putative transposase